MGSQIVPLDHLRDEDENHISYAGQVALKTCVSPGRSDPVHARRAFPILSDMPGDRTAREHVPRVLTPIWSICSQVIRPGRHKATGHHVAVRIVLRSVAGRTCFFVVAENRGIHEQWCRNMISRKKRTRLLPQSLHFVVLAIPLFVPHKVLKPFHTMGNFYRVFPDAREEAADLSQSGARGCPGRMKWLQMAAARPRCCLQTLPAWPKLRASMHSHSLPDYGPRGPPATNRARLPACKSRAWHPYPKPELMATRLRTPSLVGLSNRQRQESGALMRDASPRVGHHNILAEMKFRFVKYPPAAWPFSVIVKRTANHIAEARTRPGVAQGRAWKGV